MAVLRTLTLKVVLLVLAVQILNLSVYNLDGATRESRNTLGEPNQIDSMVEYVTEIVLDHHNAFPENGTHNNRQSHTQHQQLKHESIHMISFRKAEEILRYCSISSIPITSKQDYKYLFAREITPPPPKA
ncbi:MAG TPA: hypothetical protein VHB48_21905 [Chitinophagaceae bacterium]|nr:hypothetical protein [Chitinophagaceae bacterium]